MNRSLAWGLGAALATGLALAVGLLAASPAGAQQDTIRVDSATLNFQGEANIDLDALGIGSPGLGAWEIGVVYDPDVINAEGCTSDVGSQCNVNFSSNRVQVVGASGPGELGDTTLATIVFGCVSEGTTSLSVVVDVFADATEGAPQPISFGVVNGQVTCVEPAGLPPTPRPRPDDDDDDDVDDADDEPDDTNGVTGLPKTGAGAGGSAGGSAWAMIALAAAGLAGVTGFGALRLSARRASGETRGD